MIFKSRAGNLAALDETSNKGDGVRKVRAGVVLTDIDAWKDLGNAHGEAFSCVRPVTRLSGSLSYCFRN